MLLAKETNPLIRKKDIKYKYEGIGLYFLVHEETASSNQTTANTNVLEG